MEIALITGRILFSIIFIVSAFGHFKAGTIAFAASKGVPFANLTVPFSGVLELLGGLSILIGFETRIGALLIILFLVPVTFTLHQFWKEKDPMMKQMEMVMFLKNIAMIGGALILGYVSVS